MSREAGHTPGPLHVVKQPQFLGGEYEVRKGDMEIAFVTKEADAILYGAAPDLLEACKALLLQGDFSSPHWAGNLARAAIAKAEGR